MGAANGGKTVVCRRDGAAAGLLAVVVVVVVVVVVGNVVGDVVDDETGSEMDVTEGPTVVARPDTGIYLLEILRFVVVTPP